MTFARTIVGVDGSDASFDALVQAGRLVDEGGTLTAVVVLDDAAAAQAGFQASRAAEQLSAEAEEARARAEERLADRPNASARLVRGRPLPTLLDLARTTEADLIALGSHEHRRLAGMALGSVATHLIHEAASSVLLARAAADSESFPRRIVAGVDGSPPALAAAGAAGELARRLGAEVRLVAAGAGKGLDPDALAQLDGVERDERSPVDALVALGAEADLLVVGSHGLHGVKALGSVSERVAHRAPCSVLVVRARGT